MPPRDPPFLIQAKIHESADGTRVPALLDCYALALALTILQTDIADISN
jgi:hypothetical protein